MRSMGILGIVLCVFLTACSGATAQPTPSSDSNTLQQPTDSLDSPVDIAAIDIAAKLDEDWALPEGFTLGDARDIPLGELDIRPQPDRIISQLHSSPAGEQGGTTALLLFSDIVRRDESYESLLNPPRPFRRNIDVGEKGIIVSYMGNPLNGNRAATEVVFTRCRMVAALQFLDYFDQDAVLSYARRIDDELGATQVCAEPFTYSGSSFTEQSIDVRSVDIRGTLFHEDDPLPGFRALTMKTLDLDDVQLDPKPQRVINQPLTSDTAPGLVTVYLYEDEANRDSAYRTLIPPVSVTEDIAAGEEGTLLAVHTAGTRDNPRAGTVDVLFTRCHGLIAIRFKDFFEYDAIKVYAQQIDNRIRTAICP